MLFLLITQAVFMTGNSVLYLCTLHTPGMSVSPNYSPSSPLSALRSSLFRSLPSVPTERPTFLREYGNGMYGVTAYYLAKSTADIPFHIVFPVIGTTITYWMVRTHPAPPLTDCQDR